METLTSKFLVCILIFLGLSSNSRSQDFTAAGNVTEISCSLPDNSLNNSETGVDYLETGCNKYRVSVSNTMISLEYNGCSSPVFDSIPLQNNPVTNPDVSIVIDRYNTGTDVFAIAVYYYPGSMEYIAEIYQIDGGSLSFVTTHVLQYSSIDPDPNDNGIRIDANAQGDFVIVWDNKDNKKIMALAGNGYGTTNRPEFSSEVDGFGNFVNLLPVELPVDSPFYYMTAPDVVVSASDDFREANVYITYLSDSRIQLFVDKYDFSELLYFSTSSTPPSINSDYHEFKDYIGMYLTAGRPRISAPGQIDDDVNWEDNWMVVLTQNYTSPSTYSHIIGYSRVSSWDIDRFYTENVEDELIAAGGGWLTLNDWHKNPAISFGFDNTGNHVAQIVWEGGENNSYPWGSGTTGPTIIGVSVDINGAIETNGCINTTSLIKIVPTNNMFESTAPSVAGRLTNGSPTMIVSWWNDNEQDVKGKYFEWCDASYRRPIKNYFNPNNTNEKNIIYPNPTSGIVKVELRNWKESSKGSIEIFDVIGRRLSITTGRRNSLEQNARNLFQSLRPGIYFLKAKNDIGGVWTQKVIKR